ncbi:5390_t:CDS:2, partial [Entrophospora sp. SA101]
AMQMARRLTSQQYPNILSIHCAALHEDIINSLVLKTQPEIFHDSSVVKAIIQDHQFWHEVEKFQDVLAPAKRAVKNI